MPIELAGIKINRVHKITTLEQAAFVHHRVPGQEGNTIQNLGRDSVTLQVEGIFFGEKAKDDLEKVRGVYIKRKPVDFIADLLGEYYTGKVLVTRLDVTTAAEDPDQFSYVMILAEYVEPPKQGAAGAVAASAKLDAAAALDIAALPDALSLGSLPEVSNPFVPLKDALEPTKQAADGLMKSVDGLKKVFGV